MSEVTAGIPARLRAVAARHQLDTPGAWMPVLGRGHAQAGRYAARWALNMARPPRATPGLHLGPWAVLWAMKLFVLLFAGTFVSGVVTAALTNPLAFVLLPVQHPIGGLLFVAAWLTVAVKLGGGKPRPAAEPPAWWSEQNLMGALHTAGLAKSMPPGVAWLRRYGPPRVEHAETGEVLTETVTVGLPAGITASAVASRTEHLEQSLGLRAGSLRVDQLRDAAAGVVTFRVDYPTAGRDKPRTSHLASAERVDVTKPLIVGRDRRGRDTTVPLTGIGVALVGGMTGSGKTTHLQALAGAYALDPRTRIYLADGKGALDDWGPLKPSCESFVLASEPNADERFLSLLRDVQALVDQRNAKGGKHPPALLILEELTAFRSRFKDRPHLLREVDARLTTITQTCRATNLTVVIAAQRPSAEAMPTDARAQAGVRVAMRVAQNVDVAMVLGDEAPAVGNPLTFGKGEAVLRVYGSADVHARLDYLTAAQWKAVCARAKALRAPQDAPGPQGTPQEAARAAQNGADTTQGAPATPIPPSDHGVYSTPVLQAIRTAVDDAPNGLAPEELHARLAALDPAALGLDVASATPAALTRQLWRDYALRPSADGYYLRGAVLDAIRSYDHEWRHGTRRAAVATRTPAELLMAAASVVLGSETGLTSGELYDALPGDKRPDSRDQMVTALRDHGLRVTAKVVRRPGRTPAKVYTAEAVHDLLMGLGYDPGLPGPTPDPNRVTELVTGA